MFGSCTCNRHGWWPQSGESNWANVSFPYNFPKSHTVVGDRVIKSFVLCCTLLAAAVSSAQLQAAPRQIIFRAGYDNGPALVNLQLQNQRRLFGLTQVGVLQYVIWQCDGGHEHAGRPPSCRQCAGTYAAMVPPWWELSPAPSLVPVGMATTAPGKAIR